ncbi:MAG: hypothetical protein HZA36_01270 [Parcubacteria group bacterium]|nr:hypothetical protein [Parcubacteria group bacterium]
MSESQLENLDPAVRVRRLLANKFVSAEYFYYRIWRFVLIDGEGGKILVTAEHQYD